MQSKPMFHESPNLSSQPWQMGVEGGGGGGTQHTGIPEPFLTPEQVSPSIS